MTTPTTGVSSAVDASLLPPRWSRALRAAVLLVVGIVITFSATLHEQLAFDRLVVALSLALIGVVHLVEAWQRRGRSGLSVAVALGIVALGAAIALLSLDLPPAFPIVIAAWALVSALLEFVGNVVAPGSRQDAPIIGAVGLLLAITVLLARADVVSVIGFFGAYAVIAGVFLGIAAFDARRSPEVETSPETAVHASAP